MRTPIEPENEFITACRRHVERVRRHGRLTVALIEQVRLRHWRQVFAPAASRQPEAQFHQQR